jgi:hypothetical protein
MGHTAVGEKQVSHAQGALFELVRFAWYLRTTHSQGSIIGEFVRRFCGGK